MSRLILPPSHVIHGKPPKFACTLCEAVFTEDERHQFERHVLAHPAEDVLAHSPAHTMPAFFDNYHPDFNDVDWQRWIDDNHAKRPEQWRRWMKTGLDKT